MLKCIIIYIKSIALEKYTTQMANLIPVPNEEDFLKGIKKIYDELNKNNHISCYDVESVIRARYTLPDFIDRHSTLTELVAGLGYLEALKWVISIGSAINCLTSDAAAGGQIHVLEWLKNNNSDWSHDVCDTAIRYSNLDTLKWLYAHGHKISRRTATFAAETNKLDALKWLRANKCKFDSKEIWGYAIQNGNLEFIVYQKLPNTGICIYQNIYIANKYLTPFIVMTFIKIAKNL